MRDALVVGAQIGRKRGDHGVDVDAAGGQHVFEVGPVAAAVEERLEHGQIEARQERKHLAGERLERTRASMAVVEVGAFRKTSTGVVSQYSRV